MCRITWGARGRRPVTVRNQGRAPTPCLVRVGVRTSLGLHMDSLAARHVDESEAVDTCILDIAFYSGFVPLEQLLVECWLPLCVRRALT